VKRDRNPPYLNDTNAQSYTVAALYGLCKPESVWMHLAEVITSSKADDYQASFERCCAAKPVAWGRKIPQAICQMHGELQRPR